MQIFLKLAAMIGGVAAILKVRNSIHPSNLNQISMGGSTSNIGKQDAIPF